MIHLRKAGFFFVLGLLLHSHTSAQVLMPYRKGNLWGYADTTGKIVVTPQFIWADLFMDGSAYASVLQAAGKRTFQGLVKNTGQLIIPPATYSSFEMASQLIDPFSGVPSYLPPRLLHNESRYNNNYKPHWRDSLPEFILAKKRDATGSSGSVYLYDSTGRQLTFSPAEAITVFCYQPLQYHFKIKINGLYGVIAQTGKTIIPPLYSRLECVHEQNGRYVIIAEKNGKAGLIDMNNKILMPLQNNEIRRVRYKYSNDFLLAARKGNKEAVLRPDGSFVEPYLPGTVYVEEQYGGQNGFRIIRGEKEKKYEEMNTVQEERAAPAPDMPPPDYSEAPKTEQAAGYNAPPQPLRVFAANGLYGVKQADSVLIAPQYNSLTVCNAGRSGILFTAGKNGLTGIINRQNEVLIPIQYKTLELFFYNNSNHSVLFLAQQKNGRYGVIDIENKPILPFRYSGITSSNTALQGLAVVFAASSPAGTVWYNLEGKELFSNAFTAARPLFETVMVQEEQVWEVTDKNGASGLMRHGGAVITPPGVYKTFSIYRGGNNSYGVTFIRVKTENGKQGLLWPAGKVVADPEYDTIYSFTPQQPPAGRRADYDTLFYFTAVKNGLAGIVDMTGTVRLPFAYQKIRMLHSRHPYLVVERDGQTGIATFDNPSLVPPQSNISFPPKDLRSELLRNGFICYRSTAKQDNNLGIFITGNNKMEKQIPANYSDVRNHMPGSSSHSYFLFCILLRKDKGEVSAMDYLGMNGVPFFED